MPLYLNRRRFFLNVLLVLASLIPASCMQKGKQEQIAPSGTEAETVHKGPQKKITVYPYWVTSGQFAGFYVGKEKGIFKKHGIDLNILEYKPFISTNDIIKQGQADFAILWLVNAIQMRCSGINIVNIAQFSTRSSLMLLAKKSSGIKTISDLNGKRAGIWEGFELQPKTLFAKYNLNTQIIRIGSTNNLFLQGGVEVTNANWFDEYHAILNSGYDENELVPFFFADYGLNFLEDGVYCLEDKIKADPAVCAEFVKATVEAWLYVFNNPDESLEIILKNQRQQKLPANRSHQKWMIGRYKDLYLPAGKTTFNIMLSETDYISNARMLLQNKQIDAIPAYKHFFRPYNSLLHNATEK